MSGAQFTGLGVALATPFDTGIIGEAGAAKRLPTPGRVPRPGVDLPSFTALLRHVVRGGVDHLVVLGSTGEGATVSDPERVALVRAAGQVARPAGVPVVVGVGHNDTERTCELARASVAAGADALLVVTPYYNKPQPAGLVAHYRAVAETCPGTPLIAYNVPGRTGCNITPAAMQQIWQVPGVLALKESSGDLRQMAALCAQAPEGRFVLAGDDDLALPAIAVGARGLVSVCANVAPEATSALVRAALAGDLAGARTVARRLAPLMEALFLESNPVPLKAALACLGLGTGVVRAPLAPAEPQTWTRVRTALSDLGLSRVVDVPVAS